MALLFLFASVVTAQTSEPYAWPLDLPRQITSSFGEYRSGRFHAGIDLRTGPIGKPVYAAGDGHVVRLRCSPYGYGKAVYLHLDDGNHVVYGHLDGFEDSLSAYVRAAQHERQNYTVDLYPEAGRFPVKKGDLIAFSGDTGVGVPHLHYEFRNASNEPINPKLLDIDWPDNTRPVIRRVVIAPLDPASRVNGDILPVVLDAAAIGNGEYRTEPVAVFGDIGAGVDVIDPANEGANRLGIHVLRSVLAGEEVFRVQHDLISYDTNGGGAVAYHPYLHDEGRFLLAWRWPGNSTHSYSVSRNDGWIAAPLEDAELRLECVDFHGNSAAVTIPLVSEMPDLPVALAAQPSEGRGTVTMECLAPWLTATIAFSSSEPETPRVTVEGDGAVEVTLLRVNETTFRAGIVARPENSKFTLRVEHPRVETYDQQFAVYHRDAAPRSVVHGDTAITPSPSSPFGTLFVTVADGTTTPASDGLVARSGAIKVWPEDAALDDSVSIAVPVPAEYERLERLALYRRSGSGWSHVGGSIEGGRITASTGRFGEFAVFEDVSSPFLVVEHPPSSGASGSARPAISGRVEDVGSGLADITVHVGGQWLLTEYDPEEADFEWMRDEDLPSGEHLLTVRAVDNAGNTSTVERTITIP